MCIFFFKQKTAYEMRISDWSSDVCSSDLGKAGHGGEPAGRAECLLRLPQKVRSGNKAAPLGAKPAGAGSELRIEKPRPSAPPRRAGTRPAMSKPALAARSEEHTSELQSLMRISYAVFGLKKKNTKSKYDRRKDI